MGRIGDRDATNPGLAQLRQRRELGARAGGGGEDETALRIEGPALGDQRALRDELVDEALVGSEEDVGRGAVLDLLGQVASRSQHQRDPGAGRLELRHDLPER